MKYIHHSAPNAIPVHGWSDKKNITVTVKGRTARIHTG